MWLQLFLTLWFKLPWGWRYLLMGVPITLGILAAIISLHWIPLAVGAGLSLILVLLPGPSQSERNGYNF